MWTTNNVLIPDPDKEDFLASSPYEWPLLLSGIRLCGWSDNDIKYFLIGNPFIWWLSTFSLILLVITHFVYTLRARRGLLDWHENQTNLNDWDNFYFASKIAILGWFLHYAPFGIMGRVTYIHHYFPALIFAILALSVVFDHLSVRLSSYIFPSNRGRAKITHIILISIIALLALLNFIYFYKFTFGFKGPANIMASRRWLKSWNIYGDQALLQW